MELKSSILDLSNKIDRLSEPDYHNQPKEIQLDLDQKCVLQRGFYFHITGKCYFQKETEMTWVEARAECLKTGGDLATIANQATQDFFENYFKFDKNTFIGAQKKMGAWIWVDGSPWVEFETWVTGEPNIKSDNAAVVIGTSKKWYDVPKTWKNGYGSGGGYYLCQIDHI